MQTYDAQKAERVWQRVQGSKEEIRQSRTLDNIQELIMNEWIAAATYLRLARQMQPKQAALLHKLAGEEQTHAACLRGMYTLITGQQPVTRSPLPEVDTPELTLRRCYGREMRSLKEYEALRDDPEYGHVFARLAEQEREHCRTLLELIGGLRKK